MEKLVQGIKELEEQNQSLREGNAKLKKEID